MSSLATDSGIQPADDDDVVVDRISNLPTPILSHILSFLPTDEAIATSLLSKRWKFIWRDIHTLNLSEDCRLLNNVVYNDDIEIERLFVNFVNKILTSLEGDSIHKFSLRMIELAQNEVIIKHVINWIGVAVSRNAKVIELDLGYSINPCEMPCTLFTCNTLEDLLLDGEDIILKVPKLVTLQNLKTLSLIHVQCECDESCECNQSYNCNESIRNLISGCSSLETLHIVRYAPSEVATFTVSSPTLRKLTFHFEYDDDHTDEYWLDINAPQLSYLELYDEASGNFSVENLYLLDEAHISLEFKKFDEPVLYDRYTKSVVKLFHGLYNVTKLSLMGVSLKVLSDAGVTPSFPRVSELTVNVKCCLWDSLLKLVESLNKLQHLSISLNHKKCSSTECWSKPEKVPIRFFSCLETISIEGLTDRADELEMIEYVLQNAKILTTMTINTCNSMNELPCKKHELLKKISNFCRGSAKCRIAFS